LKGIVGDPLTRAERLSSDRAMATVLTASDALPPSDSLRALDRLNFFLAALQSGFGPFVAIYLADRGWTAADIGFVLTAGGLAGLLTQVPAGELLDFVQSKRTLVGAASVTVALAALIYALWPLFPSVLAASVLQGATGGILGLGVAAISLGLVGRDALGERLGRNQRFASIGSFVAAGVMGGIGYFSTMDIFFATAVLAAPVLLALVAIRAADIHFGRACGAPDHHATRPPRSRRTSLFRDRRIPIFAACLFLFQFANASLLPLLGETLEHAEGKRSSLVISAMVVVPQVIVALLAPWVGRTADSWGRRPLLLLGLGVVPIRALCFAATTNTPLLVVVQALDGMTGATLGVLTALIVADLTNGTGRFNLVQGLTGTLSGVGASLSTSTSGLVVQAFGHVAGFLGLTGVALAAVAILWAFMPETRPARARPRQAHPREKSARPRQ
jgi:MFS family permease